MKIRIKRLLAIFIDYIICFIISYLPLKLLRDNIASDDKILSKFLYICFVILFFLLLSIKDLIFKNKSLGKKILKICICDEKGIKVEDKLLLLKRGIINVLFSNIYLFLILINNKSVGDYIYKTKIVIENDC